MIQFFLKAKHWHLFVLIFGIPMLFYMGLMLQFFNSIQYDVEPDPTILLDQLKWFPVLMIIFVAGFFGWMWSIVMGLKSKIPDHLLPKLNVFKIFFFIPLVYILCISILIGSAMSNPTNFPNAPDPVVIGSMVACIVPLHFFSMFCVFHSFFIAAKTIKLVELQRAVTFSDFTGEFFLIWFYPIGVWILQPKINEIIEGGYEYYE